MKAALFPFLAFTLAGCELFGGTATGLVLDSIVSSAPANETETRAEAYSICRDKEAALANGDVCLCAIEYQVRTPKTQTCFDVDTTDPPVKDLPVAEPNTAVSPVETEPPPAGLLESEGTRLEPYPDSNGIPHIGIGHKITQQDAELLLASDWERAWQIAKETLGDTWPELSQARQQAIAELAFTMGRKLSTFSEMLGALRRGQYRNAAAELLDSSWARQVQPSRAERIAAAIRNG